MYENLDAVKKIHMIGIGGISMSGLVQIITSFGIEVTGSDACKSEITDKLISEGIHVTIGHNVDDVRDCDLVVYTAAIKKDDIELVEAQKLNIRTMERADFLGFLTTLYKNTIGIAGTHGKTTTTSMVSLCFLEASMDPTIQVGAILKQINGNNRIGSKEFFIIEACEYFESFLKFKTKAEIILNIDNDHLDYFKSFGNIKNAFIKYVKILPQDGILVTNGDDKNCLDLQSYTSAKFITYGINNKESNFTADNISFDNNGFANFDVYYNNNFYSKIQLSVPGKHNVYNALACIALCNEYNISKENIVSALKKFTGAHRRFEYIGSYNDFNVYDDYAHHPTEILATYNATKCKKYNKSWVIFQSHTYTRTKNLLDDFAKVLANFDNIILADIYAAREENIYNISSKDIADKIHLLGKEAICISSFDDIAKYIKQNAKPNDIVLTVGAGNVFEVASKIVE